MYAAAGLSIATAVAAVLRPSPSRSIARTGRALSGTRSVQMHRIH
jgi:hypothetical protein